MADETGPDPLRPEDRKAVLREHLEREKARRRTAEAKLAAIAGHCKDEIDRYMDGDPGGMDARFPDDVHVSATAVLAIIGIEEGDSREPA